MSFVYAAIYDQYSQLLTRHIHFQYNKAGFS